MSQATTKSIAPPPRMPEDVFRQLRDFVYELTGIAFQDNQKYLLESRLTARLKAHNLKTFEEYYNFLRFDTYRDKELGALYELVTTNETYFFRDMPQLEAFITTVVPAAMAFNKDSKQLRIWSAACSTGDEPYTLAMMLLEHLPLMGWNVEILGTDISEAVLGQAQKGLYGSHTLRHVPPELKRKYFVEHKGHFALVPAVKARVKFMHLNLYDRFRLKLVRGIDVVFCRNCLIYFDDKAKRQIVTDLHGTLRPNGYLVIGFSETLADMANLFRPLHAGRSVMYQKL
ncbi:MAG TPA: protein-glutamate O-methyltransferase CheR [Nitrospira sp.]|nr:protein-glutamate O-methyltransferase CheR [Nitrospira sp.]